MVIVAAGIVIHWCWPWTIYQLMADNLSSARMTFFNWMKFYHILLIKHTSFNLWSPSHSNPLVENSSFCCFFLHTCQIDFNISVFMPATWCISSCNSIFCNQLVPHSFTLTVTNWILLTLAYAKQASLNDLTLNCPPGTDNWFSPWANKLKKADPFLCSFYGKYINDH